jgi:hypothetical protein
MMLFVAVVTLHVGAIGLQAASSSLSHDKTVTNAAATVDIASGKPVVTVHLTNLSSVALDAWQLRLVYDLGSGSPATLDITADVVLDMADQGSANRGPVPPGGNRDRTYVLVGVHLVPP